MVLAAVADLWNDHAQFAPLQIILVQPQPSHASARGQIVFIVEVQYLENQNRHRPCPVFDSNRCSLAFSFMEFREGSLLPNQFVLHFIANFHREAESVPVLIRQTIDSVNDGGQHSEMWAINIDRHVEPSHIVGVLRPGVFWIAYPERVHVYPRRSGQRIALGDSFDLTLHTHERFNILLFLLRDTAYDGADLELETASLLQTRKYHADGECFEEICQALLHSDAEDDLETEDNSNL